jgi:ATP-independent RNA helicase DbpA
VVTLCGGIALRGQRASLENGAHIVVGTPGRIMDHLERGYLTLEGLNTLVLDEADRMLDMGFFDDIAKVTPNSARRATNPAVLGHLPRRHRKTGQTVHAQPEHAIEVAPSQDREPD